MKIAVVTPYYKEDPATLRRCIDSVAAQTVRADHFMVADGHPSAEVAALGGALRHVILPRAHADLGNVARAMGGLLAAAEGYEGVAWLDADNWFKPRHLEILLRVHEKTGAPLCHSWRTLHRPDGSRLPVDAAEEIAGRHVDTNCWLVFRPAFDLLRVWFMPRELGPVGDRVFFQAARRSGQKIAASRGKTVSYTTLYARHYERAGEKSPPDAKSGIMPAARAWLGKPANRKTTIAALGFCPEI
ncbi:MAG: glycosyltransferase family A protein [Dongiaceae bacterium]